jgi:endonuclease/exonuclease/phosphatase (EEP) superfamily protein YafD
LHPLFARLALSASTLALASCVTITTLPRAIVHTPSGAVVRVLPCGDANTAIVPTHAVTLDPSAIRVVSWNIHKQADAGWRRDLVSLSKASDLVLLQEAVLDPPIRDLIDDSGLDWIMASSFGYGGFDIGVLTASRVPPLSTCTARAVEPLLRIPKSAIVSWFALPGSERMLAVANVHAINFSLLLGEYTAQLDAIADALAAHPGPIILAGDFNTWSDARDRALRRVAARLGMTEVALPANARSRFLGHEVDHIFVRGLVAVASAAIPVKSSDHNPVLATLRVTQ